MSNWQELKVKESTEVQGEGVRIITHDGSGRPGHQESAAVGLDCRRKVGPQGSHTEREEGGVRSWDKREKQIRTYAGIEGEIRKGTVREQAILIPGHTVTNFERGVHLRGCAFK